jgi:hypothetical protein
MCCVKKLLAFMAVAALLAQATEQTARADDSGGWFDVLARDGVAVSARLRAGSKLHEMRMIGDIDAPPERVLAVLDDIERYPTFMPPTSRAKLLARDSDKALSYYYMEISPPVIAKRDYCIRVGMEKLSDGRLRSFWAVDNAGSDCPAERRGIVRVSSNDGEWMLAPMDGGRRTHIVYRCHIEVGGAVPAWMINRVSATELPQVFGAVRKAVQQPRYAACTVAPCRTLQ